MAANPAGKANFDQFSASQPGAEFFLRRATAAYDEVTSGHPAERARGV